MRFCSQARHMLTQPLRIGASSSATTIASACEMAGVDGAHRVTISSITTSVTKLYNR